MSSDQTADVGCSSAPKSSFPGARTDREMVRVLVPAALTADRCEAHEYSLAASALRGAACNTKGVCGCGCG